MNLKSVDLLILASKWNLLLRKYKKITIGSSTCNWIFYTDKGKFVLRLGGTYKNYVLFQIDLLNKLRKNFPYFVPEFIINNERKYHSVFKKQTIAVYRFIEGRIIGDYFSSRQAWEMGELVGKYYVTTRKNYQKGIRRREVFNIESTIEKLDDIEKYLKKKKHKKKYEIFFLNHFDLVKKRLLLKINKGVITSYNKFKKIPCYCDWNGTNIIINKNKIIIGVIDFGGICMEPRIFDFQSALIQVAYTKRHRLEKRKIINFCRGYITTTQLSSKELDLIYPTMIADLSLMLAWILNEKKKKGCRIKDYEITLRMYTLVWLMWNEKYLTDIIKKTLSESKEYWKN